MVSKDHGCTGAPWFDNSFESVAYCTPRTSNSCAPPPPPSPPAPLNSPSNRHKAPGSPMRLFSGGGGGSDSETSRCSISDVASCACACAPDSDPEEDALLEEEELSVEEALLSLLCDSPSRSSSSSIDISVASPFRFCFGVPRRESLQFGLDGLDSVPTIPSFVSSVEEMVKPMEPCTSSTPALHSVRNRTFSTSRFVVAVKSHVLDVDANRNAREVSILKFVASIKDFCPFVLGVKIQQGFVEDEQPLFELENYPTSLAHPEVSRQFFLSKDSDNIDVLRSLAAELYLALSFIHGNGIVHQDVKPANIMISQDGHAILGDFGAARLLPSFGQTLRSDTSSVFRKIVLQPDEIVRLTPAYAAPELMQRRDDGILEYDERVDWWSYGLSLYETVTGRLPFRLQGEFLEDDDNHEANRVREIDYQLDEFLRLLLVHDAASRLCGPMVKLHPFFDPLSGLWGKIKVLRYPPPCLCPPKLPFFSRPSSLQSSPSVERYDDDGSDLPFGNVTIFQPRSRHRDSSSSDDSELHERENQAHTTSPCRRTEALIIRRPTARIFDDLDDSDFSRSSQSEKYEYEPLEEMQEIGIHSGRIQHSYSLDTACSPPQPFPSTCSIVRYHYNDGTTNFAPPILEVDDTIERAGPVDEFDGSFNDSGLHLPLSDSAGSWDVIKGNTLRKPPATQTEVPSETTLLAPQSKSLKQKIDVNWTLDEEIAISLLNAGFTRDNRKGTEKAGKRRMSRARTAMKASARVVRTMGRRVSHLLFLR